MNVRREEPVSLFKFIKSMEQTINDLQMKEDLAHRFLNEGFSGGEKKRNEIVQMEMLQPSLAMLDEIDSGLDVDALHIVADALNKMHKENGMAMLVVSHYERFYQLIKPEYTHVLVNGKIVLEGDAELADKIDREGYDWIYKDYNVQPAAAEEVKKVTASIGTCAVRQAATSEAKK
jgi:Fe-S cluster assembly ATP-binding protein